jgi:small conductance mechanosensitive channel
VGVLELGDNGVEFTVRPYVEVTDYMPVKLTVTEQVKLRFDEAGITIPFPQRDVHINNPL